MDEFKQVSGVPAGSSVQVSVSPCDGTFVSKAKLISSTDVLTWDPCQGGPPNHQLGAGRNYFVSVRLAFIQQGAPTVEFRIPSSGGGPTVWTWTVNGTQGQVALVGGFIGVA